MTVHRVTELRCDGRGCDRAWVWEGNATNARNAATVNGDWLTARNGGRDFCTPTCRDNPQENR